MFAQPFQTDRNAMSEDFLPLYRKAKFWRFVLVWGPFFVFLVFLFGGESRSIIDYLVARFNDTPAEQLVFYGYEAAAISSGLKIAVNIVTFCVVYLISLFIVAQFILPVRTLKERFMAGGRLLRYLLSVQGPAVFVREGKLVAQVGEADNIYPGVALVDLRSALVVEQTFPWPEDEDEEDPPRSVSEYVEGLYPLTRVYGPGINFTAWGEKIRDVIDLRPQMRREAGVKAFTRDGIEVESNVFVGFSVSNPPEAFPVAYIGGSTVDDLYGIVIKEKSPGVIAITGKFKLDPQDAQEIHDFVLSGEVAKAGAPIPAPANPSATKSPFPFDKQRVFAAAYGQAHRGSSDPKTRWDELPGLVAVETFRSYLGQFTYDYLYMVDDPKRVPWLWELKPEFSRKIRQQGLLSFKLVRFARSNLNGFNAAWNLEPFDEKHFGQAIRESAFEFSAVYPLQNTYCKPLREHGIVIIFAGFSELKPPPAIRTKMAEQWKAKLDLEIQTIRARNEREAMQVINSARTQAQRDATYSLSNLLKRETYSKEALALLLFQSLQTAATDEKNQKALPPKEILTMMQNLHRWLLVEWEESEKRRPKQPPPAAEAGD